MKIIISTFITILLTITIGCKQNIDPQHVLSNKLSYYLGDTAFFTINDKGYNLEETIIIKHVKSKKQFKLACNNEGINKEDCSGEWKSGVPTDIDLKFPGENKFRTTIGARIRVLFMDMYH